MFILYSVINNNITPKSSLPLPKKIYIKVCMTVINVFVAFVILFCVYLIIKIVRYLSFKRYVDQKNFFQKEQIDIHPFYIQMIMRLT